LDKLNVRYTDSLKGKWLSSSQWSGDRLVLNGQPTSSRVPDVIGMGAKDAVYILENNGLRVNLFGKGEVYSQSLNAGTEALQGQTITIQLR